MTVGKHSRLRLQLCHCINAAAEGGQVAYAFPKLCCHFGDRSLVPDVAVFRWERIPFDGDGEVPDDFRLVPDWVVEILSPDQSSNRVIGKILYCLEQGCQLGWLIDPTDRSILDFKAGQQPILLRGEDCLSVLPPLSLVLTVNQVFGWLKMAGS